MNEKQYVAVICEYNPFHFGHQYQIQELKKRFDGVVCIMSGNIVQRGSVAVADKYLRAEAALCSGADLVVELPIPWCCSSAKDFALAGVHIAANLGVSHLAFGTEDELDLLQKINSVVTCADFVEETRNYVSENKNVSYPQALKARVLQLLGDECAKAVEKPNNILGLEYLTALSHTDILPFSVKRDMSLRSSSSIRAHLCGEEMLNQLPKESKAVFARELNSDFPRNIKGIDAYIIGVLRKMSYFAVPDGIYSAPSDLVKKIFTASRSVNGFDELVTACADKKYTAARVRRAIMATVFGITASRVHKMPPYTCVLAANSVGREVLKGVKKKSNIDIITKPVRALDASEETKNSFLFSKGIEDILALSAPNPRSCELGKSPIVR